jgi:RNA polymerase sigma factor (sigma-70 family)
MRSWKQTISDLAASRATALKRHAFLLCGDAAEAEDLVQDALVRAFARPLRTPGPAEAEAYVRTIITNRFIDLGRRKTSARRGAALLGQGRDIPDPADGVALRADLASALVALTPRQRACVVLYYYQDLSTAQVARVLTCNEGTVKRHLHDARQVLNAAFADEESGKHHAGS